MPLAPVAIPRGHKRHLQRHRLDVQSSAQQLQPSVPPQHCDQAHWDDLIVHVGFERGWETPPPQFWMQGRTAVRVSTESRQRSRVGGLHRAVTPPPASPRTSQKLGPKQRKVAALTSVPLLRSSITRNVPGGRESCRGRGGVGAPGE